MILRTWHGTVRAGCERLYIDHLKSQTFPAINKLNGFVQAQILRRHTDRGTEFCVMTKWASMDAIRAFAGDDTSTAVVPHEAQQLMVAYDRHVHHYELEYEFVRDDALM